MTTSTSVTLKEPTSTSLQTTVLLNHLLPSVNSQTSSISTRDLKSEWPMATTTRIALMAAGSGTRTPVHAA